MGSEKDPIVQTKYGERYKTLTVDKSGGKINFRRQILNYLEY